MRVVVSQTNPPMAMIPQGYGAMSDEGKATLAVLGFGLGALVLTIGGYALLAYAVGWGASKGWQKAKRWKKSKRR